MIDRIQTKIQLLKCKVRILNSLLLLQGQGFYMLCYPYLIPASILASAAAALGPLKNNCTGKGCTSHLVVNSLIERKRIIMDYLE